MQRSLATWCWSLLALTLFSACATSTSHRGDVEFGRMRILTTADVMPQPVEVPQVRYPEVLLAQSIEGTAELSFVINTAGVPGEVQVVATSDPAFGEAAAEAVRRVRYVPASLGGRAVPCKIEQTFFFRIRGL